MEKKLVDKNVWWKFHFNIKYIYGSIMSYIGCSINKRKTIKYHTDATILKTYRKIIERGKIGSTKIYDLWPSYWNDDLSPSWLDTGTSIKSCGVKLVLLAKTSSEMIHQSKMPTVTY
jgi:hypothetical protein